MFSLRAATRQAPRAVCRLTRFAARRPAPSAFVKSSCAPLRTPAAAFSSSRMFKASAGEVDEELSAKLESELAMEQEMKESSEVPVSVKEYLENGPFEIHDTPGHEEVVLTRKFGDET